MNGKELKTYLVERLRVLRKMPTDSNILSLLIGLDKNEIELILNTGKLPIWEVEAENFLLIQKFAEMYGLRILENSGGFVTFENNAFLMDTIKTAVKNNVPFEVLNEWTEKRYHGLFWGSLQEYIENK